MSKLHCCIVASSLLAACAVDSAVDENSSEVLATPGRYVVVFKSDRLPSDAANRIAKAGGTQTRALADVGVATASGTAAFAQKLAKDPAVLAVGPEHLYGVPTLAGRIDVADDAPAQTDGAPTAADNLFFYQWDMRRIGANAVWPRLPLASQPRVAVLDTGVMDNHPDLAGQVCEARAFTYCNTPGGPNASPSYPQYSTLIDFDAHPSWSPADGCTPAATTFESHGTHVSGTIAAKFGGGRVVGVAPDACIGAYKVFDRYRYTDPVDGLVDTVGAFDGPLFDAIVAAANAHYPVISMSLGSVIDKSDRDGNASWLGWKRVSDYANRKGTLVIASAGNAALDLNGTLAHVPSDLPAVMSTSASGSSNLQLVNGQFVAAPGSDVLAFYSDFGSSVDVTAPGGDCGPGYPATCLAQYLILSSTISTTGAVQYAFFAGTSMATPHVSAVAAQVRALHPELSPGDVRSWLKDHAEFIGTRQAFGHGMVTSAAVQ